MTTFVDYMLFWIAGVLVVLGIACFLFVLGYLSELVKDKIADDELRAEVERRERGLGTRYTGTN